MQEVELSLPHFSQQGLANSWRASKSLQMSKICGKLIAADQ